MQNKLQIKQESKKYCHRPEKLNKSPAGDRPCLGLLLMQKTEKALRPQGVRGGLAPVKGKAVIVP